jgi:hypothetical protein
MATTLSGLLYTIQAIGTNTTLTPGYYKTTAAATISGNLTLSGTSTDIFVIYIDGALDMTDGAAVVLGSVLAKNVFFIVNGAFATAAAGNAIFRGQLFAQTTVNFYLSNTIEGRCISLSGAMTFGTGTNPPAQTTDDSTLIQFGVLANYVVYTISGAITNTGTLPSFSGLVLTGAGAITGYGTGYDNPSLTSGVVAPSIRVEFGIYLNSSLITVSKRCIDAPISTCHETRLSAQVTIGAGQTISVKIQTMLSNTSVIVHNRNLHIQKMNV